MTSYDPYAPPPPVEPAPRRRLPSVHVTRRGVLLGGVGLVVAAGAGTGAGYLQPLRHEPDTPIPADLLAAWQAERRLIAQLEITYRRDRSQQALLQPIRADHQSHLEALAAAIRDAAGHEAPATRRPAVKPAARAALRAAEQLNSTRAATRAARLDGAAAVLLASIAACEATHAEVLA